MPQFNIPAALEMITKIKGGEAVVPTIARSGIHLEPEAFDELPKLIKKLDAQG